MVPWREGSLHEVREQLTNRSSVVPNDRVCRLGAITCGGGGSLAGWEAETRNGSARSVLGEEVFQVGLGEAAGEAFFTQHVGDCLSLALLQFPDFFFDGAR